MAVSMVATEETIRRFVLTKPRACAKWQWPRAKARGSLVTVEDTMRIPKKTIQQLAKAWLAEAKQIRSRTTCDCGCGQTISVKGIARFKPGHDAKLLREYRKKIHDILGQ
jgi:hypothetical protein